MVISTIATVLTIGVFPSIYYDDPIKSSISQRAWVIFSIAMITEYVVIFVLVSLLLRRVYQEVSKGVDKKR